MRKLFFLLPFLLIAGQTPAQIPDDKTPLVVVDFRWARDRQAIANASSASITPAPAMIAANRNFEKQKRINDPAGVRDPNADTLDGRGAELDRITQQAREPEPIEGFTYQVKVQNASVKVIKNIFWEYRFRELANPQHVSRRQFLCTAQVKPDKQRDLQVFSLSGPSDVVHVKSLAKDGKVQFEEAVLINRIEFADGTFWQRPTWNFDEVKLTSNARDTRNLPTCRGL
ncbi:MAG TPA: hypothetical protein VEL78_03560 [Pyrinomonadaceae bacterium]|nr:hypothetical protein [Pyrinomonadaceae bacterium]